MTASRALLPANRRRYWPWLIWFVATLGVPYQFILQSSTSVMIPTLMHAFQVNEAGIGFLSSSFFYSYLLLQVPAGMIIDRFGARWLLTGCMVLAGVSCFCFAHSHVLLTAEINRFLLGAVTAPFVAASMYLAANWFSPRYFALLAGLTEMSGMLGGAVGEGTLASLVLHLGWRETLMICGVVAFLLAFVIAWLVRNSPSPAQCRYFSLPDLWKKTTHVSGVLAGFFKTMGRLQVWLVGFFAGLTFAVLPAFAGLWAVPTLQAVFHVKLVQAALGSSVLFLGAAVGTPLFGWISEKLKHRRRVMLWAVATNIVVTALFVYVPHLSLWLGYVFMLLMGLLSGVYVLAFAIIRDTTERHIRASAMGFTNMMSIAMGALFLQPIMGWILNHYHQQTGLALIALPVEAYRHALLALVICLLLSLGCILLIDEKPIERV